MTREEAINKVRQMSLPKETMDILEALAPELRESEDERIRKEIIEVLRFVPSSMWEQAKTNYERCFAYLEKQKEPLTPEEKMNHPLYLEGFDVGRQVGEVVTKPAEWSEEDADMLNCCISSIEEAKENRYAYKETDGDTSYDREIDWLKSLRPSWKPSDEQLRTLEYAIDYFKKKRNDTTYLESLYNDLKKLM